MKIIRNNLIPFPRFAAINLFGLIFVRKNAIVGPTLLNHEAIHTAQMKELLYIPFYIIYILEWALRIPFSKNPYRQISFEKEAYKNDANPNYLSHRLHFAQWRR